MRGHVLDTLTIDLDLPPVTQGCQIFLTGSGGYTHKYFRVAKSSADRGAQQGAIADWARMAYGWMGRTA
ncbi:hypothetical protein ACC728_38240, partial [Rhizobium ruizarguesonis]